MKNTEILNKWFKNKEEYLAWRAAWRAEYQALSESIREQKCNRKDRDPAIRSSAQCFCWRYRQEAAALLETRKRSKLEAQRQYLAAKAALVPAH
jgi:ferredoxin-thioredoxin reductase catalytic subunit